MNWWRCWFGWHRWAKAPDFAGHVRRECARCGIPQVYSHYLGWVDEPGELRSLVQQGLAIKASLPTGPRSE